MWCWCGIKFLKGGHWEEISSCKENNTGAFWDGSFFFHATKIVAWCLMCFLAGSVPSAVARKTRSAKICGGTGEDRTTPGQNCIRLRSGTQFASVCWPSTSKFFYLQLFVSPPVSVLLTFQHLLVTIWVHQFRESLLFHSRSKPCAFMI